MKRIVLWFMLGLILLYLLLVVTAMFETTRAMGRRIAPGLVVFSETEHSVDHLELEPVFHGVALLRDSYRNWELVAQKLVQQASIAGLCQSSFREVEMALDGESLRCNLVAVRDRDRSGRRGSAFTVADERAQTMVRRAVELL